MAATFPIRLEIPAQLYARIYEAAARSDQPVESVLVESLTLLLGGAAINWEHLTATLDTLTDAQLWTLVYSQVGWTTGGRLRDLTERGKHSSLSKEEQTELSALIDEVDRMTLLRSHALLILQQRGHNVQDYLQLGA